MSLPHENISTLVKYQYAADCLAIITSDTSDHKICGRIMILAKLILCLVSNPLVASWDNPQEKKAFAWPTHTKYGLGINTDVRDTSQNVREIAKC